MKRITMLIAMAWWLMVQSLSAAPSMEYQFMRDTYNNAYQHQKLIEFFALAINSAEGTIEANCGEMTAGKTCDVSKAVNITVTQDMADASEVFFGAGEGYETGDKLVFPKGTLTLHKLSDSRLEYALTIDLSKIEDEDFKETFTFSWGEAGDILRVYYSENSGTYNGSYTLIKKKSGNTMVANGYFNEPSQNAGGVYIMEIQLVDAAKHGISEILSYKDFYHDQDFRNRGEPDHEVTSKGEINDINGSVYIQPFAPDGFTFDSNGAEQSRGGNPAIGNVDQDNGALIGNDDNGTYKSHQRFVVVKAGKTVGPYTVLGYVFQNYERNGYYLEYFGKEDLLADKGVTSDSDQLDIWALDDKNKAIVKVTGLWLTKE